MLVLCLQAILTAKDSMHCWLPLRHTVLHTPIWSLFMLLKQRWTNPKGLWFFQKRSLVSQQFLWTLFRTDEGKQQQPEEQ